MLRNKEGIISFVETDFNKLKKEDYDLLDFFEEIKEMVRLLGISECQFTVDISNIDKLIAKYKDDLYNKFSVLAQNEYIVKEFIDKNIEFLKNLILEMPNLNLVLEK